MSDRFAVVAGDECSALTPIQNALARVLASALVREVQAEGLNLFDSQEGAATGAPTPVAAVVRGRKGETKDHPTGAIVTPFVVVGATGSRDRNWRRASPPYARFQPTQ